jgi:hypothetical protein
MKMSEIVNIRARTSKPSSDRAAKIAEAVETTREICQRARAQGSGMVVYPVSDIELILEALTGARP